MNEEHVLTLRMVDAVERIATALERIAGDPAQALTARTPADNRLAYLGVEAYHAMDLLVKGHAACGATMGLDETRGVPVDQVPADRWCTHRRCISYRDRTGHYAPGRT